jgi:hypothetical protein
MMHYFFSGLDALIVQVLDLATVIILLCELGLPQVFLIVVLLSKETHPFRACSSICAAMLAQIESPRRIFLL